LLQRLQLISKGKKEINRFTGYQINKFTDLRIDKLAVLLNNTYHRQAIYPPFSGSFYTLSAG